MVGNLKIREPGVAGMFYPSDPTQLRQEVEGYLAQTPLAPSSQHPKAIIAPHAGYAYSAAVAASAYASLPRTGAGISRVVLLAPAHRLAFSGIAYSDDRQFRTPLGDIQVDTEALASLHSLAGVQQLNQAFDGEHSLEVQLPFLQVVLGEFRLVPLIVGDASADQVGELLERVWGGDETLIVVSSDLSHFLDYHSAQLRDRRTSRAIEHLAYEELEYHDACGRVPISGLLKAARSRRMQVVTADLRNSGDTAGPWDRVVGYGAYLVFAAAGTSAQGADAP